MIVSIILVTIVAGIGGYIAWRINQPEDVLPDESDASVDCNSAPEGTACVDGGGNSGSCCGGGTCPDGWTYGPGCWTGSTCVARHEEACEGHHEPGESGCTIPANGNCCCDSYSGCGSGCKFSGISCPPGKIAMCRSNNAQCEDLPSACAGCSTSCPSAGGWGCPDGYREVTGSGRFGGCSCPSPQIEKEFGSTCSICNNPMGCCACCEPIEGPENQCDHGHVDLPPNGSRYNAGATVRVEGWAADNDGIDTSRIEVFVNGSKVGNATAVAACQNGVRMDVCAYPNPVSWHYNWTVPAITQDTNYEIRVVWYDTGGRTGSNCQGTRTITGSPDPVFLQVQGRVFCQDEGGPIYPIPGANINFFKSGINQTEALTTDADGYFRSAANTTQLLHGGFAVRLANIPSGGVIDETGVAYADMTGPVLDQTNCTNGKCQTCSSSFEHCNNLTEGINYSFRWIYGNCDVPPNPDWDITKLGTPVCYEEGTEAVYIDLDYTIEVTNVAEGGDLEYVRDEFDSRIQSDWIISTTPQASEITSTYIQWNIPEGERTFAEGESRQFTYTVRIPLFNNQHLLGQLFENHVIGHLSTGEELHAYEDILIGCGLPPTGIFDSTIARIALGGILLILGFGSYQMGFLDGAINWAVKSSTVFSKDMEIALTEEGTRRRWEEKALKKIFKRNKKN